MSIRRVGNIPQLMLNLFIALALTGVDAATRFAAGLLKGRLLQQHL
jgi:hypothetical protein